MRHFLFRHGPAESRDPRRWPDDRDRPLSDDGVKQTRRAAAGFARLAKGVDVVIASPARRAHRTAELVHEALGISTAVVLWDELAPDEGAGTAFSKLARPSLEKSTPVLVGHEPMMSELVGLSLTGEAVSVAHVSKAGAAALSFPVKVAPGSGQLDWLITRAQLIDLAR